jgi:hypothetical protein
MNQQQLFPETPTVDVPTSPGRKKLNQLIQYLKDNPIADTILPSKDIGFCIITPRELSLHKYHTHLGEPVHSHALGQICDRVKIPRAYIQNLLQESAAWADDLVVENLELLFRNRCKDSTYLIRCVNNQVRGFLSNAYGRLNTDTLMETFSYACAKAWAEPYDTFMTDLHICVLGALQQTYTVKDRKIRVGVALKHSDFGAGVLGVNLFIGDGVLTLISKRGIRRIHKGRRLVNGQESHNTQILEEDTERAAAKIPPLIQSHLNKENLIATMAEIELSMGTCIDPNKVADILQALHLTEDEMTKGVDAFQHSEELPSSCTQYRLACTIAWLADTALSTERKQELMEVAGSLILPEK